MHDSLNLTYYFNQKLYSYECTIIINHFFTYRPFSVGWAALRQGKRISNQHLLVYYRTRPPFGCGKTGIEFVASGNSIVQHRHQTFRTATCLRLGAPCVSPIELAFPLVSPHPCHCGKAVDSLGHLACHAAGTQTVYLAMHV
jgi:hypothetical protein